MEDPLQYNIQEEKAPKGARGRSPAGGAGRENREAGERPARDRRRKGESDAWCATV